MINISPLFRLPFIAAAVGLHYHVVSPRGGTLASSSEPGESGKGQFQRKKEITILKNPHFITGFETVQLPSLSL